MVVYDSITLQPTPAINPTNGKLKHGLKVKNLPVRIAALERQGYGVCPPESMRSMWNRIWWAVTA